jgi:hypothetical protein
MSKRSAKPVAALFASVMAGANLVTVTDLRAQAATADDCLTAPKGASTPGSHWYYRIDRATKRQCWYLREDGDKSTRATPPVSAPVTSAAATEPAEQQPPRTITRKAISDARAEYISQRPRTEQTSPANLEPQTTGTAASTPAVQDGKRSIGTNVLAPTPLATTRLFDGSGVNASSNPADVRTAAVVADPPADQQQADAEPVQQPALQQPAALQPAPGIAFAAADSSTKPTASLQMLLLVMAAALTLAGIIVSLVFRLGRIRARRAMRRQRRAMWDSVKNKRSPQQMRSAPQPRSAPPMRSAPPVRSAPPTFHREETRVRRAETAQRPRQEAAHNPRPQEVRNPRPQEARERQVTDMLARLARSAQH